MIANAYIRHLQTEKPTLEARNAPTLQGTHQHVSDHPEAQITKSDVEIATESTLQSITKSVIGAKHFGVSKEGLKKAVQAAGPMVKDVQRQLGR